MMMVDDSRGGGGCNMMTSSIFFTIYIFYKLFKFEGTFCKEEELKLKIENQCNHKQVDIQKLDHYKMDIHEYFEIQYVHIDGGGGAKYEK